MLIDYQPDENASEDTFLQGNRELISITDFAGDIAYYACHHIYLSKQAFYILVVDMSKELNHRNQNNPKDSLYEAWTYEGLDLFYKSH